MRMGLKMLRHVALPLAVLAAADASGEIYRWTDAQGRVQFSDKPPAGGDVEEVRMGAVNTFQGVSVEEGGPMAGAPAGSGKSMKVVMYSAPWCGVCQRAKRFFQNKGIAFREMDIDKNRRARKEFDRLNGRGVPLILVGDKRMNGFSEQSFMKLYGR